MTDLRIPLRHTTRVLPFDSAVECAERYGLSAFHFEEDDYMTVSLPNGDHKRVLRRNETMLFDSTMSASHPFIEFPSWSISADERTIIMDGAVIIDTSNENLVNELESLGLSDVRISHFCVSFLFDEPKVDADGHQQFGRVGMFNGDAIATKDGEWVVATLTGTDFLLPVDASLPD